VRGARWWPAASQFVLVGLAILLYFGVRGLTEGDVAAALRHAAEVSRLERNLGLAWEAGFQGVVVDHEALRTIANWVYIWGHWPVIVPSLVWLYCRRRGQYGRLRNAFFISGAIGLVIFAAYPVAPPRLADGELVDTVTRWSNAYRVLQPPGLVNRYAAMPSLHAGWNVVLGVVMFRTVHRLGVRVFSVALPVAMCLAVVATANHYVLDVVVGAAVALLGLGLADHLASLGARHEALRRLTPGVALAVPAPGHGPRTTPSPVTPRVAVVNGRRPAGRRRPGSGCGARPAWRRSRARGAPGRSARASP
jgi:hypothetical protein